MGEKAIDYNKINVLVAENVMGYRWWLHHPSQHSSTPGQRFLLHPEYVKDLQRDSTFFNSVFVAAFGNEPVAEMNDLPDFCRDISAAFEALEFWRNQDVLRRNYYIAAFASDLYEVVLDIHLRAFRQRGTQNLSTLICLALLKTVGVDAGEFE